jgi:hypothetical protein
VVSNGASHGGLLDVASRLKAAGIGGRFVFDVDDGRGDGRRSGRRRRGRSRDLRRWTAGSKRRFAATATPLAPAGAAGRPLEAWAALDQQPWANHRAERRLARRAFFFAEAQRPPGRRLGKHVLRVLSLLRVRVGFFAFDLERVAVELSAMLRTGRARATPGD